MPGTQQNIGPRQSLAWRVTPAKPPPGRSSRYADIQAVLDNCPLYLQGGHQSHALVIVTGLAIAESPYNQFFQQPEEPLIWIPAYAGMTGTELIRGSLSFSP